MPTAELAHTGVIHTLDRTGDTRLMWSRDNRDEVDAARKMFSDLKKKGYAAYRATGKDGAQGEVIREFDPAAERIIMVKPNEGG